MAILSGFDAAYSAYNAYQNGIERYWTLRWLEQNGITELDCAVLKDGLVRADTLPLVLRAVGAENMPRGARVRVRLGRADLLMLEISGTVATRLDDPARSDDDAVLGDESEDAEDSAVEAAAPLALAIDVADAEATPPEAGAAAGAGT
jgi:exoribonuclease-2